MRPVRFVALSEDGHALVLTDEVGRLLALPLDDRVHNALRPEKERVPISSPLHSAAEATPTLAPRDIQARIRSGDSAEHVARVAGVPVDRVLRYAGPVLQERAMLAQYARRTKLRNSDRGATLAEVVDARLTQHGIDTEKISWDASRREDGTWRVIATWPSGKATAQATWELDKARQLVTPFDDMAQYLCADRTTQLGRDLIERHGHAIGGPVRGESSRGEPRRGESSRGELSRVESGRAATHRADSVRQGSDPLRPAVHESSRGQRSIRPTSDPIRAGRDALVASLDRPLGSSNHDIDESASGSPTPVKPGNRPIRGGAAALLGSPPNPTTISGSAFDDPAEPTKDIPAVPSLAVLRPRRNATETDQGDKPRKRLPSWDDVLFGGA